MKRTERHHLKQDELVDRLERAHHWYLENQRNVVNVTLVVVGAAFLLGGLYIYRGRQAERASILLNNALDEFHGAVGTDVAAVGMPSFETAEEKYRTALASFQEVADEFGSFEAGRQARYYVGVCQAQLGEYETAEEAFADVRTGDRDLLYYLASRSLAAVRADEGDHAGAAEVYRNLVDDAENPLPKDRLLFELAKAEEAAGNEELAREVYERLLAEHPDSQLRGDVMTRRDALAYRTGPGVGG